ncbi:hypothetical protein K2173_017547 [Erythroxylum novogranatense]|uniref:1-phosphatidylinositol-4-phosphate 5-kinase n=1 Tax=Erythroxylum novogranatense TaxID=1862640 RepID=A0AAV8TL89_9ROSI|nr:hypothetical protein K2173_017547 [Erythroxylum novogranatense]
MISSGQGFLLKDQSLLLHISRSTSGGKITVLRCLAICGSDALREFSSQGKSGSFFYLTQDDRFIIKTVKKFEVKVCF